MWEIRADCDCDESVFGRLDSGSGAASSALFLARDEWDSQRNGTFFYSQVWGARLLRVKSERQQLQI